MGSPRQGRDVPEGLQSGGDPQRSGDTLEGLQPLPWFAPDSVAPSISFLFACEVFNSRSAPTGMNSEMPFQLTAF